MKLSDCEIKKEENKTSADSIYRCLGAFCKYAPTEGERKFAVGNYTITIKGIEEDFKVYFNGEFVGELVRGKSYIASPHHFDLMMAALSAAGVEL